ncbi:hypothetical protein HELRODRAFT_163646 [Helobdella robusta]|uniref:Tetraspanin-6 n=1 Tax=Helobdella robusta TaxID=6412 RepID=T1EUB3_HELRO|nr:hypothetical protein HELRODRAFT_163646 [Helobdella robusta]ESN96569.1 hypothetical protein HELRODRAFT_163646 [Helobdella robusta]
MSGVVKCLQVFVSLLCIIQLALGIAFLVLGGISFGKSGGNTETRSSAIFLLVVGSIIVLVALFGLFGAISKNRCLLIIATDQVSKKFNESMFNYKTDSASTLYINAMQNGFECCGYNDFNDWRKVPSFAPTELPTSCCKNSTGTTKYCDVNLNKDLVYQKLITLILASVLTDKIRGEQ